MATLECPNDKQCCSQMTDLGDFGTISKSLQGLVKLQAHTALDGQAGKALLAEVPRVA
jgi:hypothetical protein